MTWMIQDKLVELQKRIAASLTRQELRDVMIELVEVVKEVDKNADHANDSFTGMHMR